MKKQAATAARRTPWLWGLLAAVLLAGGWFWGTRLYRQRWLETAGIEELAKAAGRDESDVAIFEKLGQRAREAEQWPRAARAFQHACELAPDRVDNWVGWARTMYEFTDFAAADAILTDFISRHPGEGRAYLERAALRRDAKRTSLAWEDVNKALELLPQSGEGWALRGELAIDMGTYQDAEANFVKARTFLPDSPWPLTGLYHATIEQRRLTPALEAARELRRRFPDVIEGRIYLGEVLLMAATTPKQYEEALEALRGAESVLKERDDERLFTLYTLMGRSLYSLKRYPEALTYLKKANAITPDNPDALFYLGRTYRALGNEKKAAEVLAFHRVVYQNVSYVRKQVTKLNLNPDDSVTRLELARWYAQRAAYKSAQVHYEELISRGLEVATAKRELAAIQAKMKEKTGANR